MSDLTAERLRELLHYDPETGEFTRLVDGAFGRFRAGDRCLSVSPQGYIQIAIDGRCRLAHRLAWLYVTGEEPPPVLDHINCVRSDNRWSNIRAATTAQNNANKRKYRTNTSGGKGVYWDREKARWRARVRLGGRSIHVGYFSDIEDASRAYAAAARLHFGEFARAA